MSLRVACYYADKNSVGRNDGSPLYYTHALRGLFGKENVEHILPSGDTSRFGKFDLHFWIDFGEDAFPQYDWTEFKCPSPNIYITSDTHLGYDYRLKRARMSDYVFCNQKKAVDDFIRDGVPKDRVKWLPHAFDPWAYSPGLFNVNKNDFDRDSVALKRHDVCFIGNLNDENRVRHLDTLFKAFPNFYWGCQRFHEASDIFNKSKIVFNVSSRKELNMRHFEALGSGSFLLTDNIPEDQNVFKEGVHFVGYDNHKEMVEKAAYYLDPSHEKERERIAEAGYIEAISNHTYLHRLLTVLDTVGVAYDKKIVQEVAQCR